jgi:hypothetical protein
MHSTALTRLLLMLLLAMICSPSPGSAANTRQATIPFTVYVQFCPEGFSAYSYEEYAAACRVTDGLASTQFFITNADGITVQYDMEISSSPYMAYLNYSANSPGPLDVGFPDTGTTYAIAAFCQNAGSGNSEIIRYPVQDNQVKEINLAANPMTHCYVFRNPDSAVTNPIMTSLTVKLHTCPDDFVGTGFYQYAQNCDGEKATAGSPFQLRLPSVDQTLYTQLAADGTIEPLTISSDWVDIYNQWAYIRQISTDAVKPPVVFCSQANYKGLPILDGAEVPNDGTPNEVAIDISFGDTITCDWYQFPGGVSAADAQQGASGAAAPQQNAVEQPGEADFSFDVLDCGNQAPRDRNSYFTDSEYLAALLAVCVYTQQPFEFTIDNAAPFTIDGNPWSGTEMSIPAGSHTIAMTPVDGYSSAALLCYRSDFDDATGPRNVVWIPVQAGAATFTLDADTSTTCSWFNVAA